jgi:hypothetical protein
MQLDAISSAAAKVINGSRACKLAATLNEYDKYYTNPSFANASSWLAGQFRQAGCVDAEVVELPADGHSRMQDWTMPLAWQFTSAELHLAGPADELLCSREKEPRCVAQWSAGTPGMVRATLHLMQDDTAYPAGSFVLTDKHPAEIIKRAREAMPAAFISDFVRKGYPDHRTMWINALSEEPGFWGVLAGQITAPVFMIPPALGNRLRQMLADRPVMLAGQIDARVGPGVMTVATAVTAGQRRDQEVVIFAHGYEAGVIDNDSGAAAIVEAAAVLGDLINRGVLPPPKRSIRWLIVSECYGMVGFYTVRAELAKRGIVGLYLDTVGDKSRPDYPFILHRTGAVNPSYANALVKLVFDRLPADRKPEYHWKYENEIPVADHMITDPMVGINSPWLGRAHEFNAWHSSDDVASLLDENSMYASAFLSAVYAYFVAAADDQDAAWLAEQMLPLMRAELAERIKPEETERQTFWRWALRKAIESTGRLAEDGAGREKIGQIARQFEAPDEFHANPAEFDDPAAGRPIPVRNVWGTITFESLPPEKRTMGSPRWSEQVNNAWYWADGQRSIAEIAQIVSLEMGTPVRKSLPAFFALAQEAGLCTLRPA